MRATVDGLNTTTEKNLIKINLKGKNNKKMNKKKNENEPKNEQKNERKK